MKKRCLLGFLSLTCATAWAQQPSLQGAKVTRLQGEVRVQQSSVWRMLQEGEQLAENALLKLTRGAHLTLRYRGDGHREEAQGPGQLLVGKQASSGDVKVERFGFQNRALQVPRSGGLDAVGGMVSNTSRARPTTAMASPGIVSAPGAVPAPISPGSPISSPRDVGSLAYEKVLPEPDPSPLALVWQGPAPVLTNPNAGAIQVNAFRGDAVIFQDDREVARLPVSDDRPLVLDSFSAEPGCLYRVELSDAGVPKGFMTYRVLDSQEIQQLAELDRMGESATRAELLQRMDRYSALGQYHRAAEAGKKWILTGRSSEAGPILQVVYDMQRDLLKDPREVEFWTDWAKLQNVELIP